MSSHISFSLFLSSLSWTLSFSPTHTRSLYTRTSARALFLASSLLSLVCPLAFPLSFSLSFSFTYSLFFYTRTSARYSLYFSSFCPVSRAFSQRLSRPFFQTLSLDACERSRPLFCGLSLSISLVFPLSQMLSLTRSLSRTCSLPYTRDIYAYLILYCNTLQHTATHCNILQHTATHCNTRDIHTYLILTLVAHTHKHTHI